MEHTRVSWDKKGGTAVMTIENPPLNILTSEVAGGLARCLKEIEKDREAAVLIITGSGEKAFMAGADIKSFPDMIGVPGAAYGFAKTIYDVWETVEKFPLPTIAAINGMALGAGCELALACDLRIADENARFGFPEIRLGLFPGGGGTQRMPRLIGKALTKEMIFTGEPIGSQRALNSGFLNAVAAHGKVLEDSLELAEKIETFSRPVLKAAKDAVDLGSDGSFREGISVEAELWQKVFLTEDIREGVNAFLEKRKPIFQNK